MTTRREARLARTAQAEPLPVRTPVLEPVTSEILTSTGPLPGQPGVVLPAPSAPIELPPELLEDSGPAAIYVEPEVQLAPIAGFTFVASFLAMVLSCFVAWALPLALIVLIMAILAVRRSTENRVFAWWALVMASIATIYSTVWLVWVLLR